jgi:hypothetical protein
MFIPNSPKPPSGMALSLAFRDGILVLLNCSHVCLALSRLQKEFVFGVLLGLSPVFPTNP